MLNVEELRAISPQGFFSLGVEDIAYIRETVIDGEAVFTIHTADGTQVAMAPSQALAFAIVRQNGLEPVYTH